MKTKLLFPLGLAILCCNFSFGQAPLTPSQWENAKKAGTLDKSAKLQSSGDTLNYAIAPNSPNQQPASTSCACWQTRDATWSVVPMDFYLPPDYRNDDGSSPQINLPFSFCLYGTSWNSCFINNNGNISFGTSYSTFTATGFPSNQFTMVAPFWGDVDTQNPLSGLPYYKITPTYMIVQWDAVGYYSSYADKVNTFQVIITNGSDPIVPGGNVSFCYKDMQWTTGDASGGSGGFGGSDAVVGANEGNGVDYIQFGAFNASGGAYNGPLTGGSGIDWLDYQSFTFDACGNSNNVPPTASGIANCDTITLCLGDTLPLNVSFLSPEPTQNTVITVDTTGTPGYTQISNTPGNVATLVSYFVASASNLGINTITITATDNGTPIGITQIPIVIIVVPAPSPVATNDTSICAGQSVQLNSSGGATYTWSPVTGLNNPNIPNPIATPVVTTTYVVTMSNGSCAASEPVVVTVLTAQATAGPDTTICRGAGVVLTATGGVSYSWLPTTGLNNPNIQNPVASPSVTTTYTCTVTNSIGCTGTDVVTVTIAPSPTASFSFMPSTIYVNGSYSFTDLSTGGVSWSWTFGEGGSSTSQNPSHTYTAPGSWRVCLVTTNATGCSDTTCSDVSVLTRDIIAPNVFTPNGDATNDVLVFTNLEYYPNSAIQIYDRWGVLVYENGNYLNDWNGKKNGNGGECVDGTYYYVLSGTNLKTTFTGFVQVIRGK